MLHLRYRYYLDEMTTSGAVPPIVRPWKVLKKVFPATLAGITNILKKSRKKRLKRVSKQFSPPHPPRL